MSTSDDCSGCYGKGCALCVDPTPPPPPRNHHHQEFAHPCEVCFGRLNETVAQLRAERDMLKTTAKWSVPLGKAEESLACIVEKLLWDLSMPAGYIEGKRDEALAAFRRAVTP